MKTSVKLKIFNTISKAEEDDKHSNYFDNFIIVLILLNVLAVLLETVESLDQQYGQFFHRFEIFSVVIFTIEYLLRLWTCTYDERYLHPVRGRLKYMISWEAIVDLMAILPFYLPFILAFDSRSIRALRLFRLLRLFKLGRYSNAVMLLGKVIQYRKEQLIITFSGVMILLIISSTFMYYIEKEAQPVDFSSIPSTMWWGVATLTTVGYGDVTPITPLGKFFGAFIAILGIGAFAVPAGILATGFESALGKKGKKKLTCPKCGHTFKVKEKHIH